MVCIECENALFELFWHSSYVVSASVCFYTDLSSDTILVVLSFCV